VALGNLLFYGKSRKTICKQMDVAVFHYNFNYKSKQGAGLGLWAAVCYFPLQRPKRIRFKRSKGEQCHEISQMN
jgi:hypothetical protein